MKNYFNICFRRNPKKLFSMSAVKVEIFMTMMMILKKRNNTLIVAAARKSDNSFLFMPICMMKMFFGFFFKNGTSFDSDQ